MQRKKRFKDTKDRGFTLMEILVVMILMSLILSISIALLTNKLPGAKQKAAAREIVATLKYAKYLAAARNERQVLVFDLDARSYGIQGRTKKMIPEKTDLSIYESDINTHPIISGQYAISYDSADCGHWGRISLSRGDRIIQIKADPIMTAVIVDNK